MSTLQGEPPSPTCRSIFAGIAGVVLLILAFFKLPTLVKYTGAVLAFIPSKVGLMQVVRPEEVIPVDMSTSPTSITFTQPGNYILYTDNYDLLVINDAVVEAGAKPWLKIEAESGDSIQIDLVSRGMAFYDTVLAEGRPVAAFTIETPGTYLMIHPTRPLEVDKIVPNYTSGHESLITIIFIVELVILVIAIRDIRAAIRSRKIKPRE